MNQDKALIFSLSLVTMICYQECKFAKQELHKLRRENGSLDTERHEHSKTVSQLQTKVAVLEQELRDKEQVTDQNINEYSFTDCQITFQERLKGDKSVITLTTADHDCIQVHFAACGSCHQ